MRLIDVKLGMMVICDSDIGFITGLAINPHGETVPVVRWDNGNEHPCHHSNLKQPIDGDLRAIHVSRYERNNKKGAA